MCSKCTMRALSESEILKSGLWKQFFVKDMETVIKPREYSGEKMVDGAEHQKKNNEAYHNGEEEEMYGASIDQDRYRR